ncbi:MAG TPA: 1,4-dihydroxy-2-naphthoate octaprenyltransferase [Bacteroidia bacterium]|nr:1,4-dihydroxy-2-naphthoate octaprenyltransferase [Bacteroidia bacterium]
MTIRPWILAARPKTLPAAMVPVWVGSMPALVDGDPLTGSWFLFWCALLSCLCIQIATNLFNDAIDHVKGADTKKRLGPRRVTASGMLRPGTVLVGALGFCLAAALLAIPMVVMRGWPIVGIGVVSLFFAYGYTGGPFPLAYRGMGELFVILFFGFVAVSGSYFVQTGEWGGGAVLRLGLQCGLYSSVLIAVNNLRDIDEDRSTGKRTLAVRFGETFARIEILLFCLVPVVLWNLYSSGHALDLAAGLIPAALGAIVVVCVFRFRPGPVYNRVLAVAALQLLLFAVAATLHELLR